MRGSSILFKVGEETIAVHRKVLDSVTEYFAPNNFAMNPDDSEPIQVSNELAASFQLFLKWLYDHDRGNHFKALNAIDFLSLYHCGTLLRCEGLKSDALQALLSSTAEDQDALAAFLAGLDYLFDAATADSKHVPAFQAILTQLTLTLDMDMKLDHMLEVYLNTTKWECEKWHNWIMDNIREKLNHDAEVLQFQQLRFVFDTASHTTATAPLREFCALLAYYQRKWKEGDGPLKEGQQLNEAALQQRKDEIDGFKEAYAYAEELCKKDFKEWWIPRDPRMDDGEMGPCFFHHHADDVLCKDPYE
jgi:hypothetical protein